jgi:hypothetical protein
MDNSDNTLQYNYKHYLLYCTVRDHIRILFKRVRCTDNFLDSLVLWEIVTSEERYQVSSYPIPTIFDNKGRWFKLLELLRDRQGVFDLLSYLRRDWYHTHWRCSLFLEKIRCICAVQEPYYCMDIWYYIY